MAGHLEDLVRSPRTHRATVSDAEFKSSWQEADAAGAGLNLLQTCENEEMVYAFDLCSKHLGADMQQATISSLASVAARLRFHKHHCCHQWEKRHVIRV